MDRAPNVTSWDSDWVKNVLAAGVATIEIEGNEFELLRGRSRKKMRGSFCP